MLRETYPNPEDRDLNPLGGTAVHGMLTVIGGSSGLVLICTGVFLTLIEIE